MNNITNVDVFRENIRKKFKSLLKLNSDLDGINLEKGVFNFAIKEASHKKIVKKWENPQFMIIYLDRLKSIYINFKDSPELIEQINSGELLPQNIASMTHQEYKPEQWNGLIEKKIKRDASKYTDNIQASTDMYTCKKCKSNRCTYYEMQTRSADEPATIFVTCLDCGKHWRS
jgi:transcription elongation factor S-II